MASSILTQREIEIVRKIAEGLNTREISEDLVISQFTVKTHRKNILRKVGVRNIPHLVHYAWSMGIISHGAQMMVQSTDAGLRRAS